MTERRMQKVQSRCAEEIEEPGQNKEIAQVLSERRRSHTRSYIYIRVRLKSNDGSHTCVLPYTESATLSDALRPQYHISNTVLVTQNRASDSLDVSVRRNRDPGSCRGISPAHR